MVTVEAAGLGSSHTKSPLRRWSVVCSPRVTGVTGAVDVGGGVADVGVEAGQ